MATPSVRKQMNMTLPSVFPGSPTFKLTAPAETTRNFILTLSQTPQSKEITKKRNSNSLEIAKNQYKLDLNMDHNILRSMAIADKEQEALKDNSSLLHGFKRMSAGMKVLGNYHDQPDLLYTIKEHILPLQNRKIQEKLRNVPAAQNRCLTTERSKWIKGKGMAPSFNDSKVFIEFLRQLFDALDEDESRKLTADELIFPLLAYGLCPDAYYIETALQVMFHCKDTDLIVVEREEFVNMFREDSKTDRILKYLDLNTKTFAKRTEKAKSPNRSETAPPEQLYKNNYETAPKLIYCKIEGYIRMLKVWWSQLHPISDMVHISRIGDFLAEKSLVSNKHEGIRIIKEVSYSNSISYHEFEKVFLKAIFKASLMNLAAGLNNGELGEADASLRLKLSSYQRFLMINGNNPDFEFKLGRNTLQAINKYQSAQPDISRNRVVKEIKEAVANHEEKHKDRIKAYLYRIKKHAKEFVNERGEVITSFKNTWDIRDIVNSKYSKNISTVLDEEQTFDEDKYLNDLLRNKKNKLESVPIARKIKTFRENYMYEKYQRTVAMTRGKKK